MRRWTPDDDALLGTMVDRLVAEQLGCTLLQVFGRRRKLGIIAKHNTNSYDPDQHDSMLGKKSDTDISGEIGVSISYIRRRRIKLGIHRLVAPSERKHFNVIKRYVALGSMATVAIELGISKQRVHQLIARERKEMGQYAQE